MLEHIINSDLVITPNNIKEKILKEASKKNKLLKCKFISIEELKRNLFETYDEKAIYYLMKKNGFKYDIAKEYLDNIYFDNKEIKKYYEELKEKNLLKKRNYKLPNNITIIGYSAIEPYIRKILKKNNVEYIKEEKETYKPVIYEFEKETDELVYAATKIIKDLSKIDINEMYLVIPNEEYIIELKRIFKLFNIPLNIKNNQSIYSTKTARDFIYTLKKTKKTEKALESIKQNEIYNDIIDILNKYTFIKEIDETYIEIIEKEIKNKKIKTEEIEGALNVINFDNIYDKDKYYYILGINQNVIPKIHEEKGILNDKDKKNLGLFTSKDLNRIEKEKVTNILINYKNIYASYKLKDNFNSFYPSALIEDLNIKVEKGKKPKLNYSNKYNKLLLSSMLDDYINYNEKNENINILYPNYKELEYKTYSNEYNNINPDNLKKYLKNKLTLSYTSMTNYFLCPFKFYIQNILKLEKKEETFPILIGNLFHYVLQNLYTKDFDIDKYYSSYLKDKTLSPKELFFVNKLKQILKKDIEVIKMQDNFSEYKEKLTEKKITIEKKSNLELKFTGIVDKISKLNNYIIITDYKTGNVETSLDNIEDGLNMQLPTYIYLIKNYFKNENKIVGFYLQKLLNNISLDGKEEDIKNNLKLNGYTIDDENIIKNIDKTYENSEVIKGLKKSSKGFYAYSKIIKENEINIIEKIVDKNIEKVIKAVEKADFKINPKRLNNKLISCTYCKFKDLCYYKEEDIKTLKQKTFKEIAGDDNAKLD